jgi:hypothetical protein
MKVELYCMASGRPLVNMHVFRHVFWGCKAFVMQKLIGWRKFHVDLTGVGDIHLE